MRGRALFLTGTQRSGSTLLEKLLGAQDQIAMLSQPFPLLFVETKRAFLHTLGFDHERYPLGHLFQESRYQSAAFTRFVGDWRTTPSELSTLFARMATYSGQYTRVTSQQLSNALSRISDTDHFAQVVETLDRAIACRPTVHVGSKETTCEEFVPALLQAGFACAIIIRDPRDVVASLNHGRGGEFSGQIKPTLFNVRQWRKSVAVALMLEGQTGFHWCRYEDLVATPVTELTRLAIRLDVGPIDEARVGGEIRDAAGNEWRGNSSIAEHRGVSQASVGAYRRVLPAGAADMIEATCLPELRALGYETSLAPADTARIIDEFREPYLATRGDLAVDAVNPENKALERARLDRLLSGAGADSDAWFLFARAAARLREALAA